MHRRPGPEAQVCHGDLGGRSRGRTKRVRAEPTPCWAGATEGRAAGAAARSTRKRARGPEGEPRWGRQGRRRGGGGGGRGGERVVASAATVGEERRLVLLWRRTRGGGGGDPPLSTWTVAEVSADTFASGRGGRTALAAAAVAAAAERSGGPGGA